MEKFYQIYNCEKIFYLIEQQRQFNTFVRDSINRMLGADYMKTHDVQDIDASIMDAIRSKFRRILNYCDLNKMV
jgi:hypothetical protein